MIVYRPSVLTSGFNGAATFQSRTLLTMLGGFGGSLMLQWGRDLSVADTAAPKFASPLRSSLQWGRDLSVADTRGNEHQLRGEEGASMGPRPFSRGHDKNPSLWKQAPEASMGPRPFSRGHQTPHRRRSTYRAASMGPRPFSRGHAHRTASPSSRSPCFNGAATFQSRTHPDAVVIWPRLTALQWGRDLSVADTRRPRGIGNAARDSFNGAATFQSRTQPTRCDYRQGILGH